MTGRAEHVHDVDQNGGDLWTIAVAFGQLRDTRGVVTGFTVTTRQVRGLRFDRVKR